MNDECEVMPPADVVYHLYLDTHQELVGSRGVHHFIAWVNSPPSHAPRCSNNSTAIETVFK